jgi:hypothetical protein
MRLLAAAALAVVLAGFGHLASGAPLDVRPGDIVLGNADEFGEVVRIDPSGKRPLATLARGLDGVPTGLAFTDSGQILVAQIQGGIVKINPRVGSSTLVAGTRTLSGINALALEPDGRILLTRVSARGGGELLRVDPVSGAKTVVSRTGLLGAPTGLTLSGGKAVVADGTGRLVLVDPRSGSQSVLAADTLLRDPLAVVGVRQGWLVARRNPLGPPLVEVDFPTFSTSSLPLDGSPCPTPSLAKAHSGATYVLCRSGRVTRILRVTTSGASSVFASDRGRFDDPRAIAVAPPPPRP